MRHRRPTFVVAIALAITVAGCAARRHVQPAADTRPAARTAEDTDRLFAERLNAGDVDGLVALYEPTATLVRQDRTAAVGTEAIRQELSGIVGAKLQIIMNVFRVLGSGDVAVLYNDWNATGTDRDGKRIELSGRAVEVVRRQADGTWRFAIDDPDGRSTPCARRALHEGAKKHGEHGHRHRGKHGRHTHTTE